MCSGTGEMYGRQSEEGELHVWGGIVSAWLSDYAGALDVKPQAVLSAAEAEGIEPVVDRAQPKERGSGRDRPTEPAVRCLAFTREDFGRLVATIEEEEPAAVAR